MCDELLTTTNYDLDEDYSNVNTSSCVNGVNNLNGIVNCAASTINASEISNQDGVIVKDLEQTLDELNQVCL